jgi:hypothetical protein
MPSTKKTLPLLVLKRNLHLMAVLLTGDFDFYKLCPLYDKQLTVGRAPRRDVKGKGNGHKPLIIPILPIYFSQIGTFRS